MRYFLYKSGVFRRTKSPLPAVVIGNIRAGGTGKSPMVMLFAEEFRKKGLKVAVLSRGYGRRTKGFLEVKSNHTAEDCGDEPLMIKRRFPDLAVCVCENRVEGVQKIKEKFPQTDLVLLDDAYQHFRLQADFYVLLTEWYQPFYRDFPLPAGMLREFRSAARRADCVITTKTPSGIAEADRQRHLSALAAYSSAPHFFASLVYRKPVNVVSQAEIDWEQLQDKEVLLVTGIANPKPLREFLESKQIRFSHVRFRDHQAISEHKLKELTLTALEKKSFILTTEKDTARISSFFSQTTGAEVWHYLPMAVEVEEKENLLDRIVCNG